MNFFIRGNIVNTITIIILVSNYIITILANPIVVLATNLLTPTYNSTWLVLKAFCQRDGRISSLQQDERLLECRLSESEKFNLNADREGCLRRKTLRGFVSVKRHGKKMNQKRKMPFDGRQPLTEDNF